MNRYGRINPISDRQREANREYARLKRIERAKPENQVCCVPGCARPAEKSPHHAYGRVGWLLNAVQFWKWPCLIHHNRIHADPAWARSLGLLAQKGEWLNPPGGKPSGNTGS